MGYTGLSPIRLASNLVQNYIYETNVYSEQEADFLCKYFAIEWTWTEDSSHAYKICSDFFICKCPKSALSSVIYSRWYLKGG